MFRSSAYSNIILLCSVNSKPRFITLQYESIFCSPATLEDKLLGRQQRPITVPTKCLLITQPDYTTSVTIFPLTIPLTIKSFTNEFPLVTKVDRIMKQKHCARAALAFLEPKLKIFYLQEQYVKYRNKQNTYTYTLCQAHIEQQRCVTAMLHCGWAATQQLRHKCAMAYIPMPQPYHQE